MTRNQLDAIFSVYAGAGGGFRIPLLIVRLLRALTRRAVELAGAAGAGVPNTPGTKVDLVALLNQLKAAQPWQLLLSPKLAKLMVYLVNRYGYVPAVAPPPAAAVYNTVLNGPNQSAQGVTLASGGAEKLEFNSRVGGATAPTNMQVFVNDVQLASVDFLSKYTGDTFRFTTIEGYEVTGAFTAGIVALD